MSKKAFYLLAFLMPAGCSSTEAETEPSLSVIRDESTGTAAHVSTDRAGAPILGPSSDVAKVTKQFLAEHKDLFGMHDPHAELTVKRARSDAFGMKHVRLQQVVRGVPVSGGEITAHYDQDGRLTSIDSNYETGVDGIDVNPAVAKPATNAELVIYSKRLAYRYVERALDAKEPAIWVNHVDAKTGELIHRYNNLQTIEATGRGVLGDTKTFQVSQINGGFVMTDTSRGVSIQTFTAGQGEQTPGTAVTSASSTQWDTNVTGAGAAVDAHTYAGVVYDYYKKVHNRNAIDGQGSAMLSTAHFSQAYDNAFWDGTGMTYGDGGQLFKALSAGLDVCAHEFTHGVTEVESNLSYENQSGALNEAVSDIFGVFIEHSFKPDPVKNWTMGEAITTGLEAGVMRDFKNPATGDQPAHMSQFRNTQQDNGGVHINSGIINNAMFLMTMGGTNPVSNTQVKFGIGWEKSEKIWYRANTEYFQTNTNFAQAAQGVLQSAKDVGLTANEQAIVECAFKAVGLADGACATITDPNTTSPQSQTPAPGGGGTPDNGATPGKTDGRGTSGDTTGDDTSSDTGDDTTSSSAPKSTKRLNPSAYNNSNGCNVVGSSSSRDFGPLAGLLVALMTLAAKRRRR